MTDHLNPGPLPVAATVEEEQANPWIFTKLGYVRQADLELFHRWEEDTAYVGYIEGYVLKATGEEVKRSFAGLSRCGVDGLPVTGYVNQPSAAEEIS